MNDVKPGVLYICPTPIGNLGDVTLRTLEVLENVDLIACEDTRDSKKFLDRYDIKTPLTSYHNFNRTAKGGWLISKLMEGVSIAVISDAGMPGISDPGQELIEMCIENDVEYTVLPGASAGICALVGSGLPTGRFVFDGFLPRTGKERKEMLSDIAKEKRTVIIYEAPHHLVKTLEDLRDSMEKRRLTITREISKKFEERIYTDTKFAAELFADKAPKGEFVLVIEGRSKEAEIEEKRLEFKDISAIEHVKIYEDKGYSRSESLKMAANDLGIPKREMYKRVEEEKANG